MYTFEKFYELPLSAEAQNCEVGRQMFVDWLYVFGMIVWPRYARVLNIEDGEYGRVVTFQKL